MTALVDTSGIGWRRFVLAFAGTVLLLSLALYGFTLALDPFGIRVQPPAKPPALMDSNQRFMYPQVIRSGRFDGAIFGTSTMRLVDPAKLGPAFDTRLANLATNAAAPWEQAYLIDLFLRTVQTPRLMVLGLDHTWCAAPEMPLPPPSSGDHAFPPWLYGESRLAMLPKLFNLESLTVAGRVLLHRLGLLKPRLREDGFGVFTPPDARYDLARAQGHIWGGPPHPIAPQEPPVTLTPAERADLRFTELPLLTRLVDRFPAATRVVAIYPPIHVAIQARPGSREAAIDAICKARIAEILLRHGATILDFRRPSAITREDSNYWDTLHYRVGIGDRIIADIKDAAATGQSGADGTYTVEANRTGL